ncbi:MAG: tRNA(Ile)-lysidine synthase [Anaerolineales bacterium]|nr:tRNA(Ile)-lysidine synthase [Anaerolineales bacterium]
MVVAVSGGPDSLCLLDCLHRLNYPLRVAHLDHGLRPGSWRDAEFVLRLARQRGLPAIVERVTPNDWLRRGLSLEEAGRQVRYSFLVHAAREWGATAIATGHTADDQAETILMHVLRGAGAHGLRGMLPRTSLRQWSGMEGAEEMVLVRPLLTIRRLQTEAHCRAAGLRPRRDETNDDTTFFRNRLRHVLLPELESYNPRVRQALTHTGEIMRREAELLDEILAAVEPAVLQIRRDGTLALQRTAFQAQPIAVQRAVLGRAAHRLNPGLRDFGFDAVELARVRLEQRRVGRRTGLPGGLELPQYAGYPQLSSAEPTAVHPPARVLLRDGVLIVSAEGDPPADVSRGGAGTLTEAVWLDRARLESELVVRPPHPGDRMQPLGMRGHRKLADIFNSLHIPAGARRNWPVVTSGEDVVWLAGLRIGHAARLTARTRKAVQLRVELAEGTTG